MTIFLVAVSAGLRADGLVTEEDLAWFDMLTLLIFTVEILLKVFAAQYSLLTYLSSGWNKLDFVIVFEGWLNVAGLTPGLVVLRMVRLLRTLRLASGFPSLRSIVGALFEGVVSSGWVGLLIGTFNYIMACLGVMLFRDLDSFHFGSIMQAWLTMLSMEVGEACAGISRSTQARAHTHTCTPAHKHRS